MLHSSGDPARGRLLQVLVIGSGASTEDKELLETQTLSLLTTWWNETKTASPPPPNNILCGLGLGAKDCKIC